MRAGGAEGEAGCCVGEREPHFSHTLALAPSLPRSLVPSGPGCGGYNYPAPQPLLLQGRPRSRRRSPRPEKRPAGARPLTTARSHTDLTMKHKRLATSEIAADLLVCYAGWCYFQDRPTGQNVVEADLGATSQGETRGRPVLEIWRRPHQDYAGGIRKAAPWSR